MVLSLLPNAVTSLSRAATLRRLLNNEQASFLLEAHNALSARIVEEAGFEGIWGSGLSLSAQCGVRDNNELSWSQVVDQMELMSDATSIPILLDGDTGYGDFNNLRRLIRKLEQRQIAGVCIEDKLFPKTNSFIDGERQPLATIEEFCGKIKAAKDTQQDPDFCFVARVEALIAGWGMQAALDRAEAYRSAGADAILIHSKRKDAGEILDFARQWGNRCPLVIVPTKYYSTPTEVFRRAGVSVVIWANHMLRATIRAMQDTARRIQATESLVDIEGRVATVSEVFRLQGADELLEAEHRYTASNHRPNAILLGATRGDGLEALTADRPKMMIPVAGQSLLRRTVGKLKARGITDISVVVGYRADTVEVSGIRTLENEAYETSGEFTSLMKAMDYSGEDCVVLYGDLLMRGYILDDLIDTDWDLVAVVDSAPFDTDQPWDFAYCSRPDDRGMYRPAVTLEHLSRNIRWEGRNPDGRWIGALRAQGCGAKALQEACAALASDPNAHRFGVPDVLNHLIDRGHDVRVTYIHGHWLDVNNLHDLQMAGDFAEGRSGIDDD